jgi:hypothetical protein
MRLCDSSIVSALTALLSRYGLQLAHVDVATDIPGSHWGAPEAGLIGDTVYVRADTPLHSALHETAHVVCMDEERRAQLHTDAGGGYAEEDAVCYLQILLARQLGVSTEDACAEMDSWGYSFRLGSALAWFTQDAEDARGWLRINGLITHDEAPTWRCRGATNEVGQEFKRVIPKD